MVVIFDITVGIGMETDTVGVLNDSFIHFTDIPCPFQRFNITICKTGAVENNNP